MTKQNNQINRKKKCKPKLVKQHPRGGLEIFDQIAWRTFFVSNLFVNPIKGDSTIYKKGSPLFINLTCKSREMKRVY